MATTMSESVCEMLSAGGAEHVLLAIAGDRTRWIEAPIPRFDGRIARQRRRTSTPRYQVAVPVFVEMETLCCFALLRREQIQIPRGVMPTDCSAAKRMPKMDLLRVNIL